MRHARADEATVQPLRGCELARGASAPEGRSLRFALDDEGRPSAGGRTGVADPFDLDECAYLLAELAWPELAARRFRPSPLSADGLAHGASAQRLETVISRSVAEGSGLGALEVVECQIDHFLGLAFLWRRGPLLHDAAPRASSRRTPGPERLVSPSRSRSRRRRFPTTPPRLRSLALATAGAPSGSPDQALPAARRVADLCWAPTTRTAGGRGCATQSAARSSSATRLAACTSAGSRRITLLELTDSSKRRQSLRRGSVARRRLAPRPERPRDRFADERERLLLSLDRATTGPGAGPRSP